MTAEYTRNDKTHQFDAGSFPPAPLVNITTRGCPSSPPVRLTLSYVGLDPQRHVAIYRVVEERSVQ